jgi:hypothetical protein
VPNGKTPWGYSSTFGTSAPIMGYKDTPRFMNPTQPSEVKASTARFSERAEFQTIIGGHLKASMPGTSLANLAKYEGTAGSGSNATTLVDSAATGWTTTPTQKWPNLYLMMMSGSNTGQLRRISANTSTTLTVEAFNSDISAGDSYRIVPYSSTVNGLCSNCHDPHGVSPTISNQAYAVPLLKGTWMTSPYKEDAPPNDPSGDHISNDANGRPRSWGRWIEYNQSKNRPSPTQPTSKHTLDRNTFGGSTRIRENDQAFAGLCLNCHNKSTLTDGIVRNYSSAGFRTSDRVHESVKGWGANSEHSFTCSKCHQAHNSGLPRLLKTDCLNYKRRGGRPSTGTPWATDRQHQAVTGDGHYWDNQHRGYPIASIMGNQGTIEATTACHVGRYKPIYNKDAVPPQWPAENRWNNVTTW